MIFHSFNALFLLTFNDFGNEFVVLDITGEQIKDNELPNQLY